MSTIIINGNTYSGNSIVVKNGKVLIDGKDETPDTKEINISVDGNIEELKVDSCNTVTINGNANIVSSVSGKINVTGNVLGEIQTISGKVNCGNVSGSISSVSGKINQS